MARRPAPSWSRISVPVCGGSSPSDLIDVNGTLFFRADDGVNGGRVVEERWHGGRHRAGQGYPSRQSVARPPGPDDVNGTLFFAANDGVNGPELWKSDGTAAGTVLVKDIFPGGGSARTSMTSPRQRHAVLSADDGVNGLELWKSDGTAAGTVLVKDIFPGGGMARSP